MNFIMQSPDGIKGKNAISGDGTDNIVLILPIRNHMAIETLLWYSVTGRIPRSQ